MIHRIFIILVTLIACGSACAQNEPGYEMKTLPSGVRVIVKPEKGSGIVATAVFVKVGANDEVNQNAGIGNFVTQLLFNSTLSRSRDSFARVADDVGGNLSAKWNFDFIEIKAVTTSAMFGNMFSLIGECLLEGDFEPQYIEATRKRLLEEVNAEKDISSDTLYEGLRELLYTDNGYRRGYLGSERTIKMAKKEDLESFYKKYFVPNNIVVAIVGDIEADQAVERVERIFAGLEPKKLPKAPDVLDEKLERSRAHVFEADVPVAHIMFGWPAPRLSDADMPAVATLSSALGGGKGSLMFRDLRQARGIGYEIGANYPLYMYQSHLMAYIITDPYKPIAGSPQPAMGLDDIKKSLLEIVEKLKTAPLSERDLKRAKGYAAGKYLLGLQHLSERAYWLGFWETVGAGCRMYDEYPKLLEKVAAEDVQKAAQKYFADYAAVIAIPKSQSPAIDPLKGG